MSNIAGYQKISFLDYPDIPASILFFAGCNMDCPYCHNKHITGRNRPLLAYKVENIIEDVKTNFWKGWIKGIVISGGEPCIHENELLNLLDRIRNDMRLWWNIKIKLDTNGSEPSVLRRIKDYVDYIAVDIKKPFPKNNSKISESIDIVMGGLVDYEFRTTAFPPWIDEKSITEIGMNIKGAKRHYIQQYKEVDDTLNIRPYPWQYLVGLKDIMSYYVEDCEIRGI